MLDAVVRSRSESVQRVERARILLAYAAGRSVSAIARDAADQPPQGGALHRQGVAAGSAWQPCRTCRARAVRGGSVRRPARGSSRWPASSPSSGAIRRSCGPPGCWARHVREHCEQAGGIRAWHSWPGERCRRSCPGRSCGRTRSSTIWRNAIRSANRRWPKCWWCTSWWNWRTSGRKPVRSPGRPQSRKSR